MEPFAGTDRYRPVRALGEGGMGQVWEVEDTTAGRRVALKTLHAADPLALYLFKNEFRALADVAHPHLVGLFDLGMAADRPFFTMELVEGAVDLLRFFRGEDHSSGKSWLTAGGDLDPDATLPPQILHELDDAPAGELPNPTPLASDRLDRVPDVLGQLAEAVAALHASKKLHRDLKPSNVLVTPDGRVVLVDFGLVASLEPEHIAHKGMIAGSVPYMSPEQSLGAELTPASDWYAFGAVLYELLTGRPPFAGARAAVLAAKRGREVVPPSLVVPDVPADLDRLCVALLALDPEARPTGEQVLHTLGRPVPRDRADATRLLGRDPHLARLSDAYGQLKAGRLTTVHVRGHSGMGKSALVAGALEAIRSDPDALVLSARCYERDHIPFKAIDPLIDALVPWLASRSREEQVALTPRQVRALTRLFPVLERIEPFVEAGARSISALDPHEEQRRAFEGLRELLARVGDRVHLVVHIDDLQWSDRDSAEILRGLFRPPDPPRMLLVLAYRTEAMGHSLALKWLAGPDEAGLVQVGPLSDPDAREVVRSIHPHAGPATVDAVVREAEGSPFFLTELAHKARLEPDATLGLDALIRARVEELPDDARRLLQVVALASLPVARAVAAQAADQVSPAAVTVLQSGRLLRSEGPNPTDRLECYHDRIRETVVADMGAARSVHLALANALERSGEADPELLSTHLTRAGEPKRALRYAREAADEALAALAFDRAAANLRLLLELVGPESDERGLILARLGDALNNAGRGGEAGEARLAAAPLVRDPSLILKAAVNFVWSGHIKRGRDVMVQALETAGITLPRSRWGMLALGLWHRLRSRLVPLRFRATPATDLDPAALARCHALSEAGFAMVANDQDVAFVTLARFVTEARRLGHPGLFVRAMAAEAFICHLEPFGHARGIAAFELGKQIAAQTDDPLAEVWLHQFEGITSVQRGNMRRACEQFEYSMELYQRIPDATFYVGWTSMFLAIIRGHQRSWSACAELYYQVLADAEARQDLALEVHLVLGCMVHPKLFVDDPDAAEAHVEEVFGRWQQDDFDLMHFYACIMRVVILTYRREYGRALALLNTHEADLRRSGAMNSGANVSFLVMMRAAATAGAIHTGQATPADVRRAARMADKHYRTALGWRQVISGWGGAALYHAMGQHDRALEIVDAALAAAADDGLTNASLCLELQRLRILGRRADDPELIAAVEAVRASGATNPIRFVDSYGPILPVPEGLQSPA